MKREELIAGILKKSRLFIKEDLSKYSVKELEKLYLILSKVEIKPKSKITLS